MKYVSVVSGVMDKLVVNLTHVSCFQHSQGEILITAWQRKSVH